MKTVKEISKLTGVSVRALHHYDTIDLLKPTQVTEAGYRLYDDAAIEKLYMILVFRELGLSLKEIADILHAPTMTETGFWKNKSNVCRSESVNCRIGSPLLKVC